jgi:hypothetical protein
MRVLVLGAALAASLTAAYADTACKTVADNSQAIRLRDTHSQDMIFTGADATDFFAAMTRLIGPMPWTPGNLAAISAHVYFGADRQKVASVHFYDGTERCDVGFDADMTAAFLNLIISKVGVRI